MSEQRPAENALTLSPETLQDVIQLMGQALRPQVYYQPYHYQMTLEALQACQNHVYTALEKLQGALPPNHWLVEEILDLMADRVEITEPLPF